MKKLLSISALGAIVISSTTFASGWECVEADGGSHAVKLYNQVDETKTPGIFHLIKVGKKKTVKETQVGASGLKVSTVKLEDRKEFQPNGNPIPTYKQYDISTPSLKHDGKAAPRLVLFVNGNPDSPKDRLADGQLRTGRLYVMGKKTAQQKEEPVNEKVTLLCSYYLKGDQGESSKVDIEDGDDFKQYQQRQQQQAKQDGVDQYQQQQK